MSPRFPFSPFPLGWFFVCQSHQLAGKRPFTKTFMGREIIAFRGRAGEACVADAHCPHLGAHIGHGGTVEDGCVRCPFHHFRFDAQGACVATPYGEPPKSGGLRVWPTQEVAGFVFAYHDPAGRAPRWFLPECDNSGLGALKTKHFRLRGHPQETTENAVDPGHLQVVHGYRHVRDHGPLRIDGPHLTGTYTMERSAGPLALLGVKLEATFTANVWGLGYSQVDVQVPRYGVRLRQWIFSTPSDGELIDLHIGQRVAPLAHPERIVPGFDKLPQRLVTAALHVFTMAALANDIAQDFEIWQHKRFVEKPLLVRGDGPITQYRRYARQFYERGALTLVDAGE